jgi:divalent metal cation (Fe/Co/Zn/Cd) transporter
MNKADWLTASAAMVGVVGIEFGLWWADAVAAALISLDITHDDFSNLRRAVVDLMDQTPTTIDHDSVDPLRYKLTSTLQDLDWVREVEVRLRGASVLRGSLCGALRRDKHYGEHRGCP